MPPEISREDVRPHQLQYQLLTAWMAIGDSYESAEEAPDGVNEAVEHIHTAMNLLGEEDISLSEARPESPTFDPGGEVHSTMHTDDWHHLAESKLVDVARSERAGDLAFVFEHPDLGLHGFRWRSNSRTLEGAEFEQVGGVA